MVLRAHIVLRCAQGLANHAMARELGVNRKTVILWRKRFAQSGLDGLRDRTRPGRKPTLSAEFVQCILDTTLHEKPRAATHWSTRTLAKHLGVSKMAIQRVWKAHGLQSHRLETFKLSRDKQFVEKLRDVVGLYLNTFICYEAVFARGVRRFVDSGAEVLVNISNDSWYGQSPARDQHLLIARMRAVENARWLLRATNDGITSIIDPAGRVVAALPSYEEGVLAGRFSYSSRTTWFTRFGEWFWWGSVLAAVGCWFIARRLA